MYNEFCYYFLYPSLVIGGSLGVYHLYKGDCTKKRLMTLSWKLSKFYVVSSDWWGDFFNSMLPPAVVAANESDDDGNSEGGDDDRSLVFFNNSDSCSYFLGDIDEDAMKTVMKEAPSIMFIRSKTKDGVFFKRTTDPLDSSTEYLTFAEKPFIQVEYIDKSSGSRKPLEIHERLVGFYVNGNTILDRKFLEWYLSYYYNTQCASDYMLEVFDKDVNVFTVSPSQKVILHDNKYRTVDCDADGCEEAYEGAVADAD